MMNGMVQTWQVIGKVRWSGAPERVGLGRTRIDRSVRQESPEVTGPAVYHASLARDLH